MTRKERLAAGWIECWGIYDTSAEDWERSDDTGKRVRYTLQEAKESIDNFPTPSVIPRPFWIKPARKPEAFRTGLPAIGQRIEIRGVVTEHNHAETGIADIFQFNVDGDDIGVSLCLGAKWRPCK